MNVKEINIDAHAHLYQYTATAVAFTAMTVWIIVACQIQIKEPGPCLAGDEAADERSQYTYFAFGGGDGGNDGRRFKHLNLWDRLTWPIVLISTMITSPIYSPFLIFLIFLIWRNTANENLMNLTPK